MIKGNSVIHKGGTGEVVEKKSRFIANVYPVQTEEEALQYITKIKKQYWDASHNCYAYVIGETNPVERCSDDGEPAKTAGRPILEVLLGRGVYNVVAVVTRYFGGTLLGTGGLIRAYTKAAQEGLGASDIITRIKGYKLRMTIKYTEVGKVQYLLQQNQIPVLHTEYGENVVMEGVVRMEEWQKISTLLIEETNGNVVAEKMEECSFALIDGKPEILA